MSANISRQRAWQLRKQAAGLCVSCGSPRVTALHCAACRDKQNRRQRTRRYDLMAAGLCISCGKTRPPDQCRCQDCADTARRSGVRFRTKRKMSGVCTRCSRPAYKTSPLCREHLKKAQEWKRIVNGLNSWKPGSRGKPPLDKQNAVHAADAVVSKERRKK